MSKPANPPENFPPDKGSKSGTSGEGHVWSMIGTLVSGPAVWGAVGWFADQWFGFERTLTAFGVIVGFLTSLYIVYIRYGRG